MTKLKKKTDVNAVKAQVVVAANRFRHGGGLDPRYGDERPPGKDAASDGSL